MTNTIYCDDLLRDILTEYSLPSAFIKKPNGEAVVYTYSSEPIGVADDNADTDEYICYFNIFTNKNHGAKAYELKALLVANGFSDIRKNATMLDETGFFNTPMQARIRLINPIMNEEE